jgi:hypothetical protein
MPLWLRKQGFPFPEVRPGLHGFLPDAGEKAGRGYRDGNDGQGFLFSAIFLL